MTKADLIRTELYQRRRAGKYLALLRDVVGELAAAEKSRALARTMRQFYLSRKWEEAKRYF